MAANDWNSATAASRIRAASSISDAQRLPRALGLAPVAERPLLDGTRGLLIGAPPFQVAPDFLQLPVQLLDRCPGGLEQRVVHRLSGRGLVPRHRCGFSRLFQAPPAFGQFRRGFVRGLGRPLRCLGGRP